MIQRIVLMLGKKGLNKVEVNINGIYIYYQVLENKAYIIVLLSMSQGTEFTKGQYEHIYNQIEQNFNKQPYEDVKILTLVVSKTPENVKNICGNKSWIVDEKNYRLLLYEDSYEDFLTLRNEVEQLCFTALKELNNSRNETESEYSNQQSEYFFDPSKDKKKSIQSNIGVINSIIIAMTVIIFLVIDLGNFNEVMFEKGGLFWPSVINDNEYYRILTCMFLHADIQHLVNNMLLLFILGTAVEKIIGPWKYGILYFGSGILSGIVSMSYNMKKEMLISSIGASGAVFGIVGALVYMVAINKGKLDNISTKQIVIFVLISLYSGFISQGIDNAAHVGGLIAGILLAAILYRKRQMKESYDED